MNFCAQSGYSNLTSYLLYVEDMNKKITIRKTSRKCKNTTLYKAYISPKNAITVTNLCHRFYKTTRTVYLRRKVSFRLWEV